MEYTPNPDSREPLVSTATITAAVTAVLALVVAFGVPLTEDQKTAILGVVAVAAPLIVAWTTRSRVYSPATVAQLLTGRRSGTD